MTRARHFELGVLVSLSCLVERSSCFASFSSVGAINRFSQDNIVNFYGDVRACHTASRQQYCPRIVATKRRKSLYAGSERSLSSSERNSGIAVLLTVPLAWGTFEPAVRFVYEIDPPMPGVVFSICFYMVASIALTILAMSGTGATGASNPPELDTQKNPSISLPLRGGLELGSYLFVGNGLQVLGLKTVNSDRAAFLLQLTTLFVPMMQGVIKGDLKSISIRTWSACVIALVGVGVMSLDGQAVDPASWSQDIFGRQGRITLGDLWIILAAFSYTFHCIRLERFAKETSALQLGAAKAITETSLSLLLAVALVSFCNLELDDAGIGLNFAADAGREISNYLSSATLEKMTEVPETTFRAIAAVLWTGLVSCGYTITAQSYGQSRVDPVAANLIYTIQPLFTAIFAWVLLGETLGPVGYLGGGLIGSAVYMVADSKGDDDFNDVADCP